MSPSTGVALSPVRDLTLSLQQYFFWRASDRDALYNKSGVKHSPGRYFDGVWISGVVAH
jgi:hypothetical protein